MATRITKRVVEAAQATSDRRVTLYDSDVSGFALRVTPNGAKSFVLRYSRNDRSRWVTIGRVGDLTPEQARQEAIRLRGEIAQGNDPAGDKAAIRGSPDMRALAERYIEEYARLRKKPRSCAEDERNLKRHILPKLGHVRVGDLSRSDLHRFHQSLRRMPVTANRCLAVVSTMLNLAERWELRADGTNPARHVDKFPEKARERRLTADELKRLGAVLRRGEEIGVNPSAVACIRLLILTGCRLGEVQMLRWENVDLNAACLRLDDSKTGPKVVPIGSTAVELLASLPRVPGNDHVIPGIRKGRHYTAIEKSWARIREVAGLPDVRIHDLRHAFASAGAVQGESLVILGGILGHASPTMTARYAHLDLDPVRAAADRIAAAQAAALDGDEKDLGIAFERFGRRSKNPTRSKRALLRG